MPAVSDRAEPYLLLRLFSRTGTLMRAQGIQDDLLRQLAAFSPRPYHPPEAYWKEAGCFEHALALSPPLRESFMRVADLLASGRAPDWQCGLNETDATELDAVWNASATAGKLIFQSPLLYWAELCGGNMLCD